MYSNLTARLKQRLQPLTGPIIQRFSRPSYRWHDNRLETVGVLEAFPSGAAVLARTQVLFTVIDLRAVPENRRLDALRLELEQQAPFDEPVTGWVVWEAGRAATWYWPQALSERVREAAGADASWPVVPEGALWPLLRMGEGRWLEDSQRRLYLLQYGSAQSGLQEQRFARPQNPEDVQGWFERHGGTAQGAPASPSHPPELTHQAQGQSLEPAPNALEQRVLPLTALLLGALVIMYLIAWGRLSWSAIQVEQSRAELEQQTAPLLQQREQARALGELLRRIEPLQRPGQTVVAAIVAEALELENVELSRWEYRSGTLTARWHQEAAQASDITPIIEKLEALEGVDDVEAQLLGDGLLEASMSVNPSALPPVEIAAESTQ